MSNQYPEGKRARKIRDIKDQENDEFWNNNQLFQDDEEDEEDFEPEPHKLVKLGSSSSDSQGLDEMADEDDIIDSQVGESSDDWEDVEEKENGSNKSVQEIEVPQMIMAKMNLQKFSYFRSLHNYVNIEELPRIGATSYLIYYDNQTYKPSQFINRHLLGCPCTVGNTGYDEQEKTKNEYHSQLFEIEDIRFHIDQEIQQLRSCVRKLQSGVEPSSLFSYHYYRKLMLPSDNNSEEIITTLHNRLDTLATKRHFRTAAEPYQFQQSIDQRFQMQKRELQSQYVPRVIQAKMLERYFSIESFLNKFNEIDVVEREKQIASIFTVQTATQDTVILDSLIEGYNRETLPMPPTYIQMYDKSLASTVDLIRANLRSDENSEDSQFARDVFDDLIKGFFGAVEVLPTNLDFQDLPNNSFDTLLEEKVTLNKPQAQTIQVDHHIPTENNSLFHMYPYTSNHYLIGRPILGYVFASFYEIYKRVTQLSVLTTGVYYIPIDKVDAMVEGRYMELNEVVFELVKRQSSSKMLAAHFLSIIRHLFPDNVSLELVVLVQLIQQLKRLIYGYQFDDISIQFFISWANNIEGSKMSENVPNISSSQEQLLEGVIYQMKSSSCNLCRIQKIGQMVFIHKFDIAKEKSEQQLDEQVQPPV